MNELALFAGGGGGILGAKLLGWRRRCYEPQLTDDYYKDRFDMVAEQITNSDGALGVGGFWNEYRLTAGKEVKP